MRNLIFIALLLAFVLIAGCTTQAPQAQTNNSTVQAAPAVSVSTNTSQNSSAPAPSPAPNATQNTTQNLSAATAPDNSSVNLSIDFSKTYSDDGKLMVYFFYSHTCPKCKLITPFVSTIAKRYENVTEWQSFDINGEQDRLIYFQFFKDMNLTQNRSGVPTILVNNTVLFGIYEINDSLDQIINGSIAPATRQ